jgi:short-subunit dehydrogenase
VDIKLKPLNEQVMVITGASSGIGLATAEAAAEQGVRLVLTARSADTLDSIVEDINAAGGEAIAVPADVADRSQMDRVAQEAIRRFGRIDTWVNDAGGSIYGKLEQVSEADSKRLFETNFWGVVNGSLVALPYLKARGGALINIGSEVSEAVVPLQGMYSASKHAVQELEKAPVAITLVQPTAVDTPFPQHAKNYMDQEPKLPDPQIDPRKVAESILEAATRATRDVKVGAMSKLNTAMQNMLPGLAQKMEAKQAARQQYDEPPRNPDGALYNPGGTGQIRGSGGVQRQR